MKNRLDPRKDASGFETFDKTRLLFSKNRHSDIWEMPVEGGEERLVLDRQIFYGDWLLFGESLYLLTREWTGQICHWKLEELDLITGRISEYRRGRSDNAAMVEPRISPDGEWILLRESPLTESDIMVVENFR